MDRLKGKRAFLTAAGAGIGRATALAFAREGAEVIATDVKPELIADLKAEGIAVTDALDVRSTAAVEAMAKKLIPDQNHVWVIVGDRAKIEKGVREVNLGELHIVDANGNPVD